MAFRRSPAVEGLRVLSAQQTRHKWAMVHATTTVAAVTRGQGTFRCRGQNGKIQPNGLMLIEVGDLHSTKDVIEPGDFDAFFLESSFLRSCLGPEHRELHFRQVEAIDEAMVASLACLRSKFDDPECPPLELSQMAATTFRTLFEQHAADVAPIEPVQSDQVARAVELMRSAYDEDPEVPTLTIDSMAQELQLSPLGLIRAFSVTIGLPPFQYLQRLRVERVRRLIEDGPNDEEGLHNLTDVAVAAGFYDLSHMGRVFRRVFSLSPRKYARQIGCYAAWTAGRRPDRG